MARNAEKAMTTLARWRAAQVQEAGGQRERRPYLASECNDLPQAEKWRLQIVREIAKKVAQIQNDRLSKMDEEQTPLPKISPALSLREQSIQSQKILELSPSSPMVNEESTKTLSPKVQSLVPTPVRQSPLNSASPNKGFNNISAKSQESNKTFENITPPNPSLTENRIETKKQSLSKPYLLREISDNEARDQPEDNESTNIPNSQSPIMQSNINKIANMSITLTNEANSLRESIKSLSEDIVLTNKELSKVKEENVNFPYHLFLIEIIINKILMKCDCFELDSNNLVITARFLGKRPITLYDPSYGKIEDFNHINVGKSALFAMTYDKICSIKEFDINLQINKQPPCSNCVTKIAESKIDYTEEFSELREELCKKWTEEQPNDNILCTTSTPLAKNIFYLSCGETDHRDPIGIIELTTRMSFLGKEITTAFTQSKPKCTSVLMKEHNGMAMYSSQNVEMDREGKILLDENSLNKKEMSRTADTMSAKRSKSPESQFSSGRGSVQQYTNYRTHTNNYIPDQVSKYDEIFTKMNANELKIRVPKSTKLERIGKYDIIQELCTCEDNPYNTGDQIQLELPEDLCYPDQCHNTYTSNLKYTYKGSNKSWENKDRKVVNVTPSSCPIPVNMEKQIHRQKDVFILKIGKKLETKDKKTDLEIELVTPKAPSTIPIENNHISQQCSSSTLKEKPTKPNKKKTNKKQKKTKANLDINPGLGEFRIRDLNDEINKLMREKRHWEVQIKALGGPDHARVGPKMLDQDGKEVPGNRGYKYFGAAKDLPGVRELFEQEPPAAPRRTRADLMRDVDADYYGYRDDDDGLLLPLEKEAEDHAIAKAVDEWKRNKEENKDQDLPEEENIYPEDPNDKRIEDEDISEPTVTSHVAVPSQKDVEEALLRRKKQELLERYGCLDVKMEES
ncbi:uncharacterized protein LOC120625920 [Pararge aegeria]|uniref:uncharacterized protein LOC120625920 n=1 Tax=Pararge aegeria TaxID=116150 RepID=UPI0019D12443|nr:uncharacterized protein LOC120625920 [Pararge aegeria]